MNFIFQYHLFHTAARESVSRQRKELWSWNKNQNVALEQMKAATMVLNILDYSIVYIPNFFKDNLTCMIVTFMLRPKKTLKFAWKVADGVAAHSKSYWCKGGG